MSIKQWIINNIKDFSSSVRTEEDLKIKVLLPYLKELGYCDRDFRFENGIDVAIGTKKTTVFSDLEIVIDGRVEMVIDTKSPKNSIAEKDVLQSASYAKLVDTPPALYGITTNGLECVVTNVYTGKRTVEIPSKKQLLREIDKSKKKPLLDIEIREIESILFTLHNTKELYKVIQECKDVIEKRGLIRSDQSFREMTKIILISTGSSSSRARVQEDDLLADVYIPIPDESHQEKLSCNALETSLEIWECAQRFLTVFSENQNSLGTQVSKDNIRSV